MKKLGHLSSVVLPLAALGLNPSQSGAAIFVDQQVIVDASNTGYDPNDSGLIVGNNGFAGNLRAFFNFDLSGQDLNFATATLLLNDATSNTFNGPWDLFRVDASWSLPGSPPTFNHAVEGVSDGDPNPIQTFETNDAVGGLYSFDVTAVIKHWIAGDYPNFGFSLRSTAANPSDQIVFAPRGDGSPSETGPRLVIAVPEPSTAGVLMLGGLLFSFRRRRDAK